MKSLLQTPEWASFKEKQGWRSFNVDGVYILEKKLPLGLSFLYAPETEYRLLNTKIYENTKKIAENSHSIFFRLEIIDENRPEIVEKLKSFGFIKAFEEIQPEWRQVIDISKSEEEILAQMKPKGRYNIKVSQKHQVEVTVCPIDRLVDGIEIFYDLYEQTGKLQAFEVRSRQYFLDLVKTLYPKAEVAILIGRYHHVPLSAIIMTFYDKVASYLYGGTSRLHKNVMAPYAAHWQAMKLAKEKGCEIYDLLAISPIDNQQPTTNNKEKVVDGKLSVVSHKYAGITQFKEQFGGRKVHLVGGWDMVFRTGWYKMFKAAEKFRRK